MHKFLLSTATAALALGMAGGLAVGLSGPAMANNMPEDVAASDCQTQLDQLEQNLEEQDLDQMAMRDVDQKMKQAERALNNDNSAECLTIVSSLHEDYFPDMERTDQMAAAEHPDQQTWGGESAQTMIQSGTSGERIVVDQPEPEVAVTQPAPRVRVQQVAPEISVTQAQPEVLVEERAPKITVIQPPPQIIIERADPKVSVKVPEPEVGVEQKDVQVSVVQPEPEISVQQGEPSVRIIEPEPEIVLDESGEADISVSQAEPEVSVSEQAAADIELQQQEAEVSVEQARPDIDVERVGEADIRYQNETETAMTDQEAELLAETQPSAGAEEGAAPTPPMPSATAPETGTEMEADVATDQPMTAETGVAGDVLIARDVIGMELATVEGNQIGEVDDIVYDATGQYYIVVKSGGFLGMGEKTRFVPMDRVSVGEDNLIVMSEADLQTGFDQTRFTSVEPDFEMEAGTL